MGKKVFEKRAMAKKQASSDTKDRSRHKRHQLKASTDSTDDAHQTKDMDILTFKMYLAALYEKRASIREKTLMDLVDAFEGRVLSTFVEETYITLLYRYLNSIKIGSANEACLASRAIGLLAITVGRGSSAHELMEESKSQLSAAHKSGSDLLKRSVADCLAITTFVGANNFNEVEESMKILWETCHPKSGSTAGLVNEPTTTVIAAAISAWSFLLTSINRWGFSSKSWSESIPFLSTLLEKDDGSVRVAASQAIALILEIESSRKEDGLDIVDKGSRYVEDLANDLDFFETDDCSELSKRILRKALTWSKLIQITFLKRFLGNGFLKHLKENDMFHDILDLQKKNKNIFLEEKRVSNCPGILTDKQRTRLRNECRILAQDRRHGYGHYDVNCHE